MSSNSDGSAPPAAPSGLHPAVARSPSRRGFIQAAVAAALAPAALPAAAQVCDAPGQTRNATDCEELLSRYGSEFGDVRRVR
jgi:hypothetical protein